MGKTRQDERRGRGRDRHRHRHRGSSYRPSLESRITKPYSGRAVRSPAPRDSITRAPFNAPTGPRATGGNDTRSQPNRGSLYSRITRPEPDLAAYSPPQEDSPMTDHFDGSPDLRSRGINDTRPHPNRDLLQSQTTRPQPNRAHYNPTLQDTPMIDSSDRFPGPRSRGVNNTRPQPNRGLFQSRSTRQLPYSAPRVPARRGTAVIDPFEESPSPRSRRGNEINPFPQRRQEWNPETDPGYIEGLQAAENYETGVKQGLYHLKELKEELGKYSNQTTSKWLAEIHKLEKRAQLNQRLVIGVMGETGAGKSSLINKLLEEERLVPTNGMRASTATVVEIAYNFGPQRYRAKVEFISSEEWTHYLEILFGDIKDGKLSGASGAAREEYLVACAMIKAVYGFRPGDIENYTVAQLVNHEHIRGVLGEVKEFAHDDPDAFHHQLQGYVDSKEKTTREMAYWPLIRVVRVYVKAPILQTGLVIADLPGVQDSNPARAKVAIKYLQECSRIWVVAPIVRAVDNKTAKYLLGAAFRRQLQMDGSYALVSFICTKTDDISFGEVAQMPNFAGHYERMRLTLDEQTVCISKLKPEKVNLEKERNQVNENLLKSRDDCIALSELAKPPENNQNRLSALKQQGLSLERRRRDLEQEVGRLEKEIASKTEINEMMALELDVACVQARNRNVKEAMKEHFAEGIQELHTSDESYLADAPTRNYKSIADAVPVFCVSSRAYQQMQGQIGRDQPLRGFYKPQHTEIPQLRDHCVSCTVLPRQNNCLAFLNSLESLLNSIRISLTSGQSLPLEAIRQGDREYLERRLEQLKEHDFKRATQALARELNSALQRCIYDVFDRAVNRAEAAVPGTLITWNGGEIAWNTYRAICRRNGVYSSDNTRDYNWNADLAQPIVATLAGTWEKAFEQDIPAVLAAFEQRCRQATEKFCQDAERNLSAISSNTELNRTLALQVKNYGKSFGHMCASMNHAIKQDQKTVNREIQPTIKAALSNAYREAGGRSGAGAFHSMKAIISNAVRAKRNIIFRGSVEKIREQMGTASTKTNHHAKEAVDEIFSTISQDYKTIVDTSKPATGSTMFQREIGAVLERITMFKEPAATTKMAVATTFAAAGGTGGSTFNHQ